MPVIVVINRKGGSGKSTLATHLAAYAANQRMSVMLGDLDKQQSSRLWLNLRQKITKNTMPPIVHWARGGEGRLPSLPNNNTLLVIDTPGGLQGLELAKVVMMADAVLIPVCDALFDRNSAAECIEELKLLPRVRAQRCTIGVVAMRIDSRMTDSVKRIAQWANEQGVEFIGHLRHANMYVSCIEKGLTLFDAPPNMVAFDLKQWKPILDSLRPLFNAMQQPKAAEQTGADKTPVHNQAFNGVVSTPSHTPYTNRESAPLSPHNLIDLHRLNANLAALATPVPIAQHSAIQTLPTAQPVHYPNQSTWQAIAAQPPAIDTAIVASAHANSPTNNTNTNTNTNNNIYNTNNTNNTNNTVNQATVMHEKADKPKKSFFASLIIPDFLKK